MVAHLPLSVQTPELAVACLGAGEPVIHLFGDDIAQDLDGNDRPHSLHQVHSCLMPAAVRDRVCLVTSGGIAADERVTKAIVCGTGLVAIDFIFENLGMHSIGELGGRSHLLVYLS